MNRVQITDHGAALRVFIAKRDQCSKGVGGIEWRDG